MSDTLLSLIAHPGTVNILGNLQAQQELAQSQAATALTQQQVQGASIGNQLQGLNLAKSNYLLGQAGVPGVGQNAPSAAAQPNMPAAAGAAAPTVSVGGAGAPAAGPAAQPQQPWPGQASYQRYGVPLDPLTYAQVATASDPTKAMNEAMESRRQRLYQIANVPTAQFPQAARDAFAAGLITPDQLQNSVTNPADTQSRILQAFKDPESHASAITALTNAGVQIDPNTNQPVASSVAQGAKAGMAAAEAGAKAGVEVATAGPIEAAKAGAKAQYEPPVEMTVKNPDGTVSIQYVPRANIPQLGAGAKPTTAADMANPAVSITPAAFAGRVGQTESGNNPAVGQSATSSASGSAQFLPSTFVPLARQIAPQQTQGMSDAQVAALRNDTSPAGQALVQQATQAYAQQNAGVLQAAGAPVTAATLGLAHRFGGQGAVSVLNAPANAPISSVVSPQVMAANPDLKGMTVGGVLGKAYGQYGVNPVSFEPQGGAGAAGAAPVVPGAIVGKTSLSPQGQAALDTTKDMVKNEGSEVEGALQKVQQAQTAQTQLLNIRSLSGDINTGSLANARQTVQNYLATFGNGAEQRFVTAITDGTIDPSKAGATQEFVKLTLQQAGQAEQSTLGARGGFNAIQLYQKAFPNIEMQHGAIKDMANLLLVAHQRDIDYGTGVAQFYNNSRDSFLQSGPYQSTQKFDQQFIKDSPPAVYAAAAAALNDVPYSTWSKTVSSPEQIAQALRIAARTDPTASILGPDGKTRYRLGSVAGGQ